ncbi:uncharacterized protein LODBEIA_P60050 [Lodderomyces beijingensis]|uniref:Uncharacterized protein n=1 Tax=Lodderomyces beijingensis TaxID=1775926 RepID=A0ABP0ZW45_9ASCO
MIVPAGPTVDAAKRYYYYYYTYTSPWYRLRWLLLLLLLIPLGLTIFAIWWFKKKKQRAYTKAQLDNYNNQTYYTATQQQEQAYYQNPQQYQQYYHQPHYQEQPNGSLYGEARDVPPSANEEIGEAAAGNLQRPEMSQLKGQGKDSGINVQQLSRGSSPRR